MNNRKLVLAFKTFLAEAVKWALSPPAKPGPFALVVSGDDNMARANITTITLPPVAAGNPDGVVRRDFLVTPTGSDPIFNHAYAPGEEVPVTLKLVQGTEYTLSLTDQDQAGNHSPSRTLTFVPTDVTPPAEPGSFQMQVTGEVEV